jgi:hypothetical protein
MSQPNYDAEYARRIERHANLVVEAASSEGWLTYIKSDEGNQSPLQQAINDLAGNLQYQHFDGDGCLEHGS